jgi:hypothetical protein
MSFIDQSGIVSREVSELVALKNKRDTYSLFKDKNTSKSMLIAYPKNKATITLLPGFKAEMAVQAKRYETNG